MDGIAASPAPAAARPATPRAGRRQFVELFAGGGMASLGFGPGWECTFANDVSPLKAAAYRANHPGAHFACGDIRDVHAGAIPGHPELVWASSPCQDLSVAGNQAGLQGERSGLFWEFWRIVGELEGQGRPPGIALLENVSGAITSRGGRDFDQFAEAFTGLGYTFAPMVVDAGLFLPHSRPRLFIVGVHASARIPQHLLSPDPVPSWTPPALAEAWRRAPAWQAPAWAWLSPPPPLRRRLELPDVVRPDEACEWHAPAQTASIMSMMSAVNLAKLEAARAVGGRSIGLSYRRTRIEGGTKVQRAEGGFEGTAGCLRTPGGASSRQVVFVVEDGRVRSRLLSSREAARLMGLPDSYVLPGSHNDALKVTGDGVAVDVVRWLATNIVEPILDGRIPELYGRPVPQFGSGFRYPERLLPAAGFTRGPGFPSCRGHQ